MIMIIILTILISLFSRADVSQMTYIMRGSDSYSPNL